MGKMLIRPAQDSDYDAIWKIFHSIVSKGDTYAYSPDTTPDEAIEIWCKLPKACFVVEKDNQIVGTYYIKTNQPGQGSHVCNCGYMVAEQARGQGLASAMCKHSQIIAKELGYIAMQFNLVVSTNTGAIALWEKLGFKKVGELEKAFKHPTMGLVNAWVMYKVLV